MEEKVPCTHAGCPALVSPSKLVNHLLKCRYAVLHCIFERSGCKSLMKQEKMREHIKQCAFAPSIVTATELPSTSSAATSGSHVIPCAFQGRGCPAKVFAWRMESHKNCCRFREMSEAPATVEETEPKGPRLPPRDLECLLVKSSRGIPCTFKELGCPVVAKKQSRLSLHSTRCPFMQEQYCKLLGLSDCLLSSKVADWPAHATEVHGIAAVWTKQSDDFELTTNYRKTAQARDLEWLMSVDWKPVAIAVQAKKPYTLWLKTKIIQGERIAWMVTDSGENCGAGFMRLK